jgi:prepilin-type N-terminal cleavage/methylation domain-containing protein
MNRRKAFTLIELLTVIAIIAVLAAITFPVFARVKLNAYKSSDISSMNAVRAALQIYREDQGGYPPALLGYITPYQYANGETVVPANLYRGALFPKRIDSLETIRGSQNRASADLMVPGAWPPADNRPTGTAPDRDTNGDGVINGIDDIGGARQAFTNSYANANNLNYYFFNPFALPSMGSESDPGSDVVGRFYAISGYDVAPVRYADGQTVYELHYTRFWTNLGMANGGAIDDPRQLGYSEPPGDTVVTWNTFFRDYSNNQLTNGGSKDIVLFLNGSARPVDSRLMAERAWRFR